MSKKIRTTIFLTLILCIGAFLRIQELLHTLEYDEIWTLQTYLNQSIKRIFSDFDLPNNHPLNTIAVCLTYFGKEYFWTIRLGSILASLGSIAAGYFLVRRLANVQAGLFTALALAFLPNFVLFGSTARGYSGQLLFLLLTAFFLLKAKKSLVFSVLAIISGLLAAISLPTSILWLFPLGCTILLRSIKKKNFRDKSLFAIIIIGICNAAWLLYNFQSYRKGTAFQAELANKQLLTHLFNIFSANGFPLWMTLLFFILMFRKKLFSALLFVALFAPLVTLFTTPGPYRVYQPSGVCSIMLISIALPQLSKKFLQKYRKFTPVIFIFLLLTMYFPVKKQSVREPDWKKFGEMISRQPPVLLPCFTATASFPAQWNFPKFSDEFIKRLQYCANQEYCIMLITGSEISGTGINSETVSHPMPQQAQQLIEQNSGMHTLKLKQISTVAPGTFSIILLPVQPTSQFNAAIKYLLNSGSKLIVLNSFMNFPLQIPSQAEALRYRMLAVTAGSELRSSPGIKIFIPAL